MRAAQEARKRTKQAARRTEQLWKARWQRACSVIRRLLEQHQGAGHEGGPASTGGLSDEEVGERILAAPTVSREDVMAVLRAAGAELERAASAV